MEKSVSLTYEEINALLEMSMLTYAKTDENAASSALIKLGAACREFAGDDSHESRVSERFAKAA